MNESILSHVSIGTDDLARAARFYDVVLGVLGCRRLIDHPGAIGYGKRYPELRLHAPHDGKPFSVGNGTHVGLNASTREEVHAFYEAAVAAGAVADGAPGPRPDYGAPYYGCFVRDLDGHKIEAALWDAPM